LRDLELYQAIIAGYYLPAYDRQAMQSQLDKLAKDDELRQQVSQQSLSASEYYSAERVSKIWEAYYTAQVQYKDDEVN
jgi:1,2-diacylglycerol-3-alpha-glucose alpha-1,2-galactosyltransferase